MDGTICQYEGLISCNVSFFLTQLMHVKHLNFGNCPLALGGVLGLVVDACFHTKLLFVIQSL